MNTSSSEISGDVPAAAPFEHDGAALGEMLRRARERRGLTLRQIANETKIPERHLEALERGNAGATPGGFYRRAEIRTYAQAVKLDRQVVLAHLGSALERPAPSVTASEVPRSRNATVLRKHVLVVIGVVIAAVVLGRAVGRRAPALDREDQGHGPTDVSQQGGPSGRATPADPHGASSKHAQVDSVAAATAPSEEVPTVATEPTGRPESAASNGDSAIAVGQADAVTSAESSTQLVITTEPAGAHVTVNGIGWGIAPATIRYLPPGSKRIRVSKEGYVAEERVVRLAEGDVKMIEIQLRNVP